MHRYRLFLVSALLGAFATRGGIAAPDEKKSCMESFEASQQLRKGNKLLAAREQLAICSRDVCPGVIKTPCKRWVGEIDAELPSFLINISAEGDTGGIRVLLDGKEIRPGVEVPVDPGPHQVRAEGAGWNPIELQLEANARDKNRKVGLSMTREKVTRVAPVAPTAAPPSTAAPSRPIPALAYALGGVGILGLGAFAYLGLSGRSEEDSLKNSCAPFCEPGRVDRVDRRYLFADISLGASVLALGAATWLILSRPEAPPSAARLGVGVGPQGASLQFSRGF
jgi:hypothetical protein